MRPQSTNGTAERIRRTLITISCGCAHSHQPRPMRALVITVEHCLSPGRTWVEVPALVVEVQLGKEGTRGNQQEPEGTPRNHLNLRCLILKSPPSWRSRRPAEPASSRLQSRPPSLAPKIENLEAALREPRHDREALDGQGEHERHCAPTLTAPARATVHDVQAGHRAHR